MRIMSIDPSLNDIGVGIYDTECNMIVLSETLSFKDKDKKSFLKHCYDICLTDFDIVSKDIDKQKKDNFVKLWTNERLYRFAVYLREKIEEYNVNFLLTENQFNIDTMKIVGIVMMIAAEMEIGYEDYYPMVWKKDITGKGNVEEVKLTELVLNVYNSPLVNHMTEHEIDAFGLILSYLNKHNIKVRGLQQQIIFDKVLVKEVPTFKKHTKKTKEEKIKETMAFAKSMGIKKDKMEIFK